MQQRNLQDLAVLISALVFVLIPGILGILLFGKLFQAVTGIEPNDPLPNLIFSWLCFVIPMAISLGVSASIGGLLWAVVISLLLEENELKKWIHFPAPHIPILTPIFARWWAYLLARRRKE